jgi:hypothetical protein
MKKPINITCAIVLSLLTLCSCHRSKPIKELQNEVAATFKKKTGRDVSDVSLIRVDANKYEGTIEYIMYGNVLHKKIRVTTDLDNPDVFEITYRGELWE